MRAKCNSCNTTFTGKLQPFTEKKLEEDLFEIGLECPKCKKWYHSHFLNGELKATILRLNRMGQRVERGLVTQSNGHRVAITARTEKLKQDYLSKRAEYEIKYKEFQVLKREERGVEAPQLSKPKESADG